LLPKSLLSIPLLPKSTSQSSWIRSTAKSAQSSASSVRLSAESSWISGDGLLAVKTLLVVADGRLSAIKWAGRVGWSQSAVRWERGRAAKASQSWTETRTA
jgi:hypothetical protein